MEKHIDTLSTGGRRDAVHTRLSTTTLYILLGFSLAGLLAGFAVGGLAGHFLRGSNSSAGLLVSSRPMVIGHNSSPLVTAAPENISLGVPGVAAGDYTAVEIADGATGYQFSAQIIDKAGNTSHITGAAVCRLWLTDDPQATTDGLSADNYAIPRDLAAFNQPFPQEITGALNFAPASPQTQPCAANGKTSWTYALNPELPPGTYYLVVLADWKGVHYNWSLVAITTHNSS